ncbi:MULTISPECIES: Ig-like domain-containing protein, partial [unclassified Pseudomonas]
LQVGEPQLELVKPIVLGEQDGALEPGDLPGGIGKLTAPRPTVKPTQSGDIVTYTWTGEVTGTTEDSVTLNGLSKDKDVHFTLNATFVAEHIEPNRGKKVTVSYRIWRAATSETSYSNVLEFGVGQAIGQLLPPAVKEADGGTRLDPLNAQTHLTAVVNYDGMLVGDQITAIWTGADGTLPEGSHTTAPWPVTTLGPQEIPLEPKVVAFSLGKAVTVNYKVTRGSSSPMPSDSLTLSVLPLPENVLDKPLILQAADNGEGAEFDVSQLTDNAVIQVNAWPFIALKQFVWLRVQGTNNDDSPYAQTFWQPPLSQTNETWITQGFYTHPIPFNELKNLRDGSELKVEFKAGLSGSQDENNALPFQVRTYTVKAVEDVKPAITRLTDSNGDEIAEGGSTVDTSITLTGTASKGQKIDVLDGTVSKGQPTADSGTGVWTLLVSGLSAGAHSFTAKALYGSGQSSAPRTLTVAVAVTPAIDSVTD